MSHPQVSSAADIDPLDAVEIDPLDAVEIDPLDVFEIDPLDAVDNRAVDSCTGLSVLTEFTTFKSLFSQVLVVIICWTSDEAPVDIMPNLLNAACCA